MKRNRMVDILKGICIVFVIVTHFEWQGNVRMLPFFPYLIDMAVPIFMIISGYVYSISYEAHKITSIGRAYCLDYVIDKLVRYTMPFALIYILELAAFYRIGQTYGLGEIIWTFFNGGFGYGSYYFPIMIQFIFVFPIVYFIVKRFDFAGLLICGGLNACFEFLQWVYFISDVQYRLILFRYLLLIACGCYFYIGKGPLKKWIGIVSTLVGGVFIGACCYGGYTPHIVKHWTRTSFIAVLFIIPCIGLVLKSEKCRNLKCPPLEFLGKASYHIFLSQMFFYQFLSYPLSLRMEGKPVVLSLLISIVASICFGIVFYMIESGITKLLMKGIHKLEIMRACDRVMAYINNHVMR